MDDIEFSIIGLNQLIAKLNAISYDLKRKGGRTALRKAAKLVMKAAEEGAVRLNDPKTARSIADNLAVRWNGRLFRNTGDLGFRVGVQQGAKLKDGGDTSANAPTPHWRLLEFGTEKMAARPFMRPALENNINKATDMFVTEYERAIDRALKRAAKKAGAD